MNVFSKEYTDIILFQHDALKWYLLPIQTIIISIIAAAMICILRKKLPRKNENIKKHTSKILFLRKISSNDFGKHGISSFKIIKIAFSSSRL